MTNAVSVSSNPADGFLSSVRGKVFQQPVYGRRFPPGTACFFFIIRLNKIFLSTT